MSTNTITLNEPEVNSLMAAYTGLQLERGPTSNGPFTLLVQFTYVADQVTYTFLDSSGTLSDWYRSRRYGPAGLFGAYSNVWPVTEAQIAGITLAELEREVARRTGPFFQASQDESTASTAISAVMPALRSTAVLGGPENLWLLRRGVLLSGLPTTLPIPTTDRQRLVQSYDSGAGRVIVERNWGTTMYASEVAEFTHLDPAHELRVATLAGLRRCFFPEVLNLGGGGSGGIDLTATAPWITSPGQVTNVQYGWGSPYQDAPFDTLMSGGHVIIPTGGFNAGGLWVTAARPVWSLVNGANSATGPVNDNDVLTVDLDYAASAGHIEAWHLFPSRMRAAAAAQLQASQEDAAREFTRQAMIHGPSSEARFGLSEVFSLPRVG